MADSPVQSVQWSTRPLGTLAHELMFRLFAGGRDVIAHERRYTVTRAFSRLLLGVSGHGTVTVNRSELQLLPGRCLLLPSNVPSGIHMRSDTVFRWLFFRCDYAGCVDLCSVVPPDQLYVDGTETAATFSKLVRLLPTDNLAGQFRCQAFLLELLRPFYRSVRVGQVQQRLARFQRFAPVFRHVQENLARPIGCAELASLVGLNTNYFSNLFSATFGITPVQFVNQQRVLRAKGLLTFSGLTVRQIARELGFRDAFYFSKVFKAAAGVSPRQYRRQQEGFKAQP